MPISDTRTYASITSPLSRMMSITSARPLGRGRSMYPRGWVAMLMRSLLARTALGSLLTCLLGRPGRWLRRAHGGVDAAPPAAAIRADLDRRRPVRLLLIGLVGLLLEVLVLVGRLAAVVLGLVVVGLVVPVVVSLVLGLLVLLGLGG